MAGQTVCQYSSTSGGLNMLAPTLAVLVKERITFSKGQLVRSFPDGCALIDLLVELGLDHLDDLRVLQVADLHRLMIVHFCEPPWLIRYFQPALFLQTLEDRGTQEMMK